MGKIKKILSAAVLLTVFLFSSTYLAAGSDLKEAKIPDSLHSGLKYLLSLTSKDENGPVDLKLIQKVLDFVVSPKNSSSLYYTDELFGSPSAYYEFDINRDLKHILQYAYNPDIPSFAFMPSSVRLSYWTQVNGQNQDLPKLWTHISNSDCPIVVKGVEHIEITPDQFTGAYYSYDIDKALILCKYLGRNLLITISKQKDKSDVGKKGIVLGSDDNWDYLYSGRKGLSMRGLGWVSSYMYNSIGISFLYEVDSKKPVVKYAAFKWLRAGWADMNVVKNKHIHKGLVRYANDLKIILEHPLLPEASELAKLFSDFENYPPEDIRAKVKSHLTALKDRYNGNKLSSGKNFPKNLNIRKYLDQMTNKEIYALLVVEYMKSILGKNRYLDNKLLFSKRQLDSSYIMP
ncbi:MAG: hypothetical protein JRG74_06795 [Deltaproteobacteria bacterium]|nr:hypothetical protein [Deltaproteobacteria bacterium]MBW1834502.1 hypothetical protein [Deltaproteobacteria bacterium]MBW2165802.1 hypothetical protein [Deltaproteobacteria bacterium]